MKTLLLHASYSDVMSYFDDWIDAFKDHPAFDIKVINVLSSDIAPKEIKKLIETAELIIIHHSMNGDTLQYINPFLSALKNRKGKIVSFVGNEVSLPILGMAPKIKILKELEVDIIATQLLLEAGKWLYADCTDAEIISLPHALNPKTFYPKIPCNKRLIDIGTRSFKYSVYVGDRDRNDIIDFFNHNALSLNLSVDLGLTTGPQRFNREEWCEFLNKCKSTVSTEAGTFYLERDDHTIHEIEQYLKSQSKQIVLPPENFARQLYRKIIPYSIRQKIVQHLGNRIVEPHHVEEKEHADYIFSRFFANALKCPVYSKAISSRHFDAIGANTLQVMFPGRYNDILVPGEHYFELQRDFSNIDELLPILNNTGMIEKIVKRTHAFVLANHTHKHRLESLLKYL